MTLSRLNLSVGGLDDGLCYSVECPVSSIDNRLLLVRPDSRHFGLLWLVYMGRFLHGCFS